MRHAAAWVVMWIACFWLWLLLAGDWNRIEWIAAASGATVAATVGEIVRSRADVWPRVPLRLLAQSRSVPAMIVADFGLLVWVLLLSLFRRKVVRGAFRSHELPAGDAGSPGFRAAASIAATYSPNAYVLSVEEERNLVLLHDLVVWRQSEKPA